MTSRHTTHFPWTVLFASILVLMLILGIMASQQRTPLAASQEGLGSWTEMSIPGLNTGNRVYAVRRANNLLLVGTQLQGMFRSTNGGSNWQHVPQYAQSQVRDMLLVGAGSQVTLAATWGDGLLHSTDNGDTWSRVGQNISTDYFYSLASKSGAIYAGTGTSGIWKSMNEGGTWNPTGSINSPGAVSIAAATNQIVYAGSVNNGLYKTTNGGGTWNRIGFVGKTVRAVAVEPGSPDRVFASVIGEGVSRSTDGGGSWESLTDGLPDSSVLSLLVTDVGDTRQVLAGTTTNGVYLLSSGTWQAWGLAQKEVPSLSDWNDRIYAGTNQGVWEYAFQPTPTTTNTPTPTATHTATSTPTPTATHTATFTPTPPATPTPGLSLLYLSNDPSTAIEAGDEVIYSITVRNGQQPLTDVEIANPIPVGVVIVLSQATPGMTVSADEIRWVVGELPAGSRRDLSYRAMRPTGTPTVTVIVNTGVISSGKFAGTPISTMTSNGVTNPSGQFFQYKYLPLLTKRN